MMTAPSPEQVAARVAMIRRQMPDARIIGIHTPGIWLGGTQLRVNGEHLPVAFCASPLHISEALVSHSDAGLPLVIITNFEESQLSLDVMARLAGRRLHRIDRWQMVRDLFCARQIDPRLSPHGWIADALLQKVPDGGYPPVASGVLDVDTVWTHLLKEHLGPLDGRPDGAFVSSTCVVMRPSTPNFVAACASVSRTPRAPLVPPCSMPWTQGTVSCSCPLDWCVKFSSRHKDGCTWVSLRHEPV
jgi:hypothetical protein